MKHFKQNKRTPNQCIYITHDLKMKLQKVMTKYHVSLSTITEVAYIKICKYLTQENRNELSNFFIDKGKRTYVKPKIEYRCQTTSEEMIRLLSNILYLYINNKCLLTYTTEETRTKILGETNQELQKKNEIYWDLNNQIRTNKRAYEIIQRSLKQ